MKSFKDMSRPQQIFTIVASLIILVIYAYSEFSSDDFDNDDNNNYYNTENANYPQNMNSMQNGTNAYPTQAANSDKQSGKRSSGNGNQLTIMDQTFRCP